MKSRLLFFLVFLPVRLIFSSNDCLLLWTTLENGSQVTNSEAGSSGLIIGEIEYLPGRFGKGFRPAPKTGDQNIPSNYIEYRGIEMGQSGCIEFWYQPDWIHTSHVVTAIEFGRPGQSYIGFGYNDWQRRGGAYVFDHETDNSAYVFFYPHLNSEWSTVEPFHVAVVWDGLTSHKADRIRLYFNGVRQGTAQVSGDPTMIFPDDLYWGIGSRLSSGDWDRHNWSGSDGVIDNLKIWNYAKTNFDDRFEEGTSDGSCPVFPLRMEIASPSAARYLADDSFILEWKIFHSVASADIVFYYGSDASAGNGVKILEVPSDGFGASVLHGSFLWNTSLLPEADYYIFAVIDDGQNEPYRVYAPRPIKVRHVSPRKDGLLFWNKLGSPEEVLNSEWGVSGESVNLLPGHFASVRYGNGVGGYTAIDQAVRFDGLFGTGEFEEFAVDFWQRWAPYEGSSICQMIFLANEFPDWSGDYFYIWIDSYSDHTAHVWVGLHSGNGEVSSGWQIPCQGEGIDHLAFSVNLSDSASEKIRLFVNGSAQESSSGWENNPPDRFVFPASVVLGASEYDQAIPKGFQDNCRIWNYAKTSFGDRCDEEGVLLCSDMGTFVSVSGTDANPGSLTEPFLTIQKGIEAAKANGYGNVFVSEGRYTESLDLKDGVSLRGGYAEGFQERDLTLRTHRVRLDGEGQRRIAALSIGQISASLGIEGFVFTNAVAGDGVTGSALSIYGSSGNTLELKIANNLFTDCGGEAGVFVGASYTNISILNNRFIGCRTTALGALAIGNYLSGAGSYNIYNNIFHENSGMYSGAIYFLHGSRAGYICNNLFSGHYDPMVQSPLISQGIEGPFYFQNNIVVEYVSAPDLGGYFVLSSDPSEPAAFRNNCFYYPVPDGFDPGEIHPFLNQEGNFLADPRILDGHGSLDWDSPCIDTGATEHAPSADIFGISRPQGAGVDIGPAEYIPGSLSFITLVSPPADAKLPEKTPVFKWAVPDSGSGHFMLEIASDSSFRKNPSRYHSRESAGGFEPHPPVLSRPGSAYYTILRRLPAGSYFWRVWAWDGESYHIHSEARRLTIE